MEQMELAYSKAKHRLLLLDYDGTLAVIAPTPDAAQPTARIISILQKLVRNPRNKVVIISGRPAEIIDTWLGETGADAAAEHGHFIRQGVGGWQRITPDDSAWKLQARKHMSMAVQKVPMSFIEEKKTSLVWHHRQADPVLAKQGGASLLQSLKEIPGVHVSEGAKNVEARQAGIDKGLVARRWLDNSAYDFILAAGDDTTDEDLFAALPKTAFTIKIGPGNTIAKERLASPSSLLVLLEQMAK